MYTLSSHLGSVYGGFMNIKPTLSCNQSLSFTIIDTSSEANLKTFLASNCLSITEAHFITFALFENVKTLHDIGISNGNIMMEDVAVTRLHKVAIHV